MRTDTHLQKFFTFFNLCFRHKTAALLPYALERRQLIWHALLLQLLPQATVQAAASDRCFFPA